MAANRSTNRSTASKTSTARKPAAKTTARSSNSRATTKRSSSTRSTTNQAKPATTSGQNGNGVAESVKSFAGKAAVPAVAVGAAAVGIALKSRARRKTVLGVKLPRSIGKSLPDVDAKSIAKSVGRASKQFAKTAKGVSKDLERAGDQAERIGKILD